MAIGCTCNNCLPEAPDITVNQTVLQIGDIATLAKVELFTVADSTAGAGLIFTLDFTPYSDESVLVLRNGVAQRLTTDYTVSDGVITLLDALLAGDSLEIRYLTLEDV